MFDREVLENFKDMEAPNKPIKISGIDTNYNFVEDCHKYLVRKFEIKGDDGFHESANTCHIISINARGNPIEKVKDEPPSGNNKRKGRRGANHWVLFCKSIFCLISIFAASFLIWLKMPQIL